MLNKSIHHNYIKGKRMMKKACIILVIFGLPLFVATGFAYTAKDASAADTILTKLLNAVENNDFNSFVADGDGQFKATITRQMFDGVNAMITAHMKKGYEVIPLGVLSQQGRQIYLRKLVFKDGGDDLLAKLALHEGKVIGFWFPKVVQCRGLLVR
jgi:hypothetical protein